MLLATLRHTRHDYASSHRAHVVGRLAPSPTGGLHLGHARTFLIAWLAARQAGGRVILRIEDLDATRVRAEAALGPRRPQLAGLDWDEGRMSAGRTGHTSSLSERGLRRRPGAAQSGRACLSLHLHARRYRASRQRSARGGRRADLSGHVFLANVRPMRRPWAIARSPGDSGVAQGSVAWDDIFLGRVELDPSQAGRRFPGRPAHGSALPINLPWCR